MVNLNLSFFVFRSYVSLICNSLDNLTHGLALAAAYTMSPEVDRSQPQADRLNSAERSQLNAHLLRLLSRSDDEPP